MDVIGEKTLEIMKKATFYNEWIYSFILPHLGKETLEIGAGIGNFSDKISKKSKLYTIDINESYVKKLKEEKIPKVSVGYGDIEKGKYFFKDKKFDTIICLNVLEHINDHESALKNMYSLLNKNGKVILLVPAHAIAFSNLDKSLGHYRRYNTREVSKLATSSGFKIKTLRYINLPGIIGWYINGKLLNKKILPEGQVGIFDKVFAPWLKLEKHIFPPVGLSVLLIAEKK